MHFVHVHVHVQMVYIIMSRVLMFHSNVLRKLSCTGSEVSTSNIVIGGSRASTKLPLTMNIL